MIAVNMALTEAEALKFWPINEQYRPEVAKINDSKLTFGSQLESDRQPLKRAVPAVNDLEGISDYFQAKVCSLVLWGKRLQ
jgi:hypothetical protein